jgi:hypothetical protein
MCVPNPSSFWVTIFMCNTHCVYSSSQADELYKICSIMGTPTQQSWPEGLKLAAAMNFRFPTFASTPLSKLMTHASPEAIDLITCRGHLLLQMIGQAGYAFLAP